MNDSAASTLRNAPSERRADVRSGMSSNRWLTAGRPESRTQARNPAGAAAARHRRFRGGFDLFAADAVTVREQRDRPGSSLAWWMCPFPHISCCQDSTSRPRRRRRRRAPWPPRERRPGQFVGPAPDHLDRRPGTAMASRAASMAASSAPL